MPYDSLYTLYYQKTPEEWEQIYQRRFHSASTHHFPLDIRQLGYPTAHPAFYCLTEDMLLLQDRISSAFLSLRNILHALPPIAITQFLRSCLVIEVQSSSAIEGVHSSRREIRETLLFSKSSSYNSRFSGIVNKYTKILTDETVPLETCEDVRHLYDDFILKEVVEENPANYPDGSIFRKDSVDVVSATQKPIHRGIQTKAQIIHYMETALAILHDETIPFLFRISIFHYFFGYIHPFYDGNGRMSRFITSYLLSKRYDPTIALRLSLLLKTKRNEYYKLFTRTNADNNRGDLTPFILRSLEFIVTAILDTQKILEEKQNRLLDLSERLLTLLKNETGLDPQSKADSPKCQLYAILLQAAIFSDIGATTTEIQTALGKSRKTIDGYLKQIPPEYLRTVKEGRTNHYRLNLQIIEKEKAQ